MEAARTYGSDFESVNASQMLRVPVVTGSQERFLATEACFGAGFGRAIHVFSCFFHVFSLVFTSKRPRSHVWAQFRSAQAVLRGSQLSWSTRGKCGTPWTSGNGSRSSVALAQLALRHHSDHRIYCIYAYMPHVCHKRSSSAR